MWGVGGARASLYVYGPPSCFICSHGSGQQQQKASNPSFVSVCMFPPSTPRTTFLCLDLAICCTYYYYALKTLLNLYNSLFTGFCLQVTRFHRFVPLIPCHPKRVFASSTRVFCCMVISRLSCYRILCSVILSDWEKSTYIFIVS